MDNLYPAIWRKYFYLVCFAILTSGIANVTFICRSNDIERLDDNNIIKCLYIGSFMEGDFVEWSNANGVIAICIVKLCKNTCYFTCNSIYPFGNNYTAWVSDTEYYMYMYLSLGENLLDADYYISKNGGKKTVHAFKNPDRPASDRNDSTLGYRTPSSTEISILINTQLNDRTSGSYKRSTDLISNCSRTTNEQNSNDETLNSSKSSELLQSRTYTTTYAPDHNKGEITTNVTKQEEITGNGKQSDDNTPGLRGIIQTVLLTISLVVSVMVIYTVQMKLKKQGHSHQLQTSSVVGGGQQAIRLAAIAPSTLDTFGNDTNTRLNNIDSRIGDRIDLSEYCDIPSQSIAGPILPPIIRPPLTESDMSSQDRCIPYEQTAFGVSDLVRFNKSSMTNEDRNVRISGDRCYEDINDDIQQVPENMYCDVNDLQLADWPAAENLFTQGALTDRKTMDTIYAKPNKKHLDDLYARPSKSKSSSPNPSKPDVPTAEAVAESSDYAELQEVQPKKVKVSEEIETVPLAGKKNINLPIFGHFLALVRNVFYNAHIHLIVFIFETIISNITFLKKISMIRLSSKQDIHLKTTKRHSRSTDFSRLLVQKFWTLFRRSFQKYVKHFFIIHRFEYE